jgi:hypothetical protein
MMKSFVVALLVGSATTVAFAPAKTSARGAASVGTAMSYEDQIGAQAPLGFFDPIGLVANADESTFNRLRYVEIKHGRISMLAVLGHFVTTGGLRLPGDIDYHGTSFESIPAGFAAFSKIPAAGLAQLFAFIGFLELAVMKDVSGEGEFVGDFRNGAFDLGWDVFSPEEQVRKRGIELNNGRAAMMGILALMVHEMLPSHDPYMINALVGYPIDFNAGF